MTEPALNKEDEVLARWNYSHQEWKHFVRWHKRRKSLIHLVFHLLNPFRRKSPPEITITPGWISIDQVPHNFGIDDHVVKKVGIRDTGKFNLLEISCKTAGKKTSIKEIKIPIPKGKLREAIEIQERLDVRNPNP
jgi:hypothetical protein